MLYSDVQRALDALKTDFSNVVEISSIGKTWQGRDINLIKIDATSMFK
jgi:murein tripeptide amidase MpaA